MLCAEGIPIFSYTPRQHSDLSITPHRPSLSLDTLRAFLACALRHKKFNYDENEPILSAPLRDTVTDKGPSQRMGRLLAVSFGLTATREEVPLVVTERNLQEVRLHDVTVPYKVLPNPETIAEQNRHLITSISPRARSATVITSSGQMQRPFPTPLPSTYYYFIRGASISASCLTAVNGSLCFVPGILAIDPVAPVRQRGLAGPTALDICRY
jgi:hypothetical protein